MKKEYIINLTKKERLLLIKLIQIDILNKPKIFSVFKDINKKEIENLIKKLNYNKIQIKTPLEKEKILNIIVKTIIMADIEKEYYKDFIKIFKNKKGSEKVK